MIHEVGKVERGRTGNRWEVVSGLLNRGSTLGMHWSAYQLTRDSCPKGCFGIPNSAYLAVLQSGLDSREIVPVLCSYYVLTCIAPPRVSTQL